MINPLFFLRGAAMGAVFHIAGDLSTTIYTIGHCHAWFKAGMTLSNS
jgi:hypothetical protein